MTSERKTVPYSVWEMGLYPHDAWEVVGYELVGPLSLPQSVEIRRISLDKEDSQS